MSEAFSLDGLRATPNALYYKHHTLQEEYGYGYAYRNEYGECIYHYPDGGEESVEMWQCERQE